MKDPYESLGISKQASQDDIKNAYRSLAKKYHPDLNPGNKEAEKKFKDIAHAYEVLGTAENRARFDRGETPEQIQAEQQRQQQQYQQRQGQARPGSSYYNTQQDGGRYSQSFGEDPGMEDIFENLFHQGRRGSSRHSQGGRIPGEDQLYQMRVDFKDSVLGADREITLPNGKKLQIKIPPGIESGQRLRFKGQGGPGTGGAPAGDAYVEVNVQPLDGFKREGNNLETELPISFMEGILGAEVQVPTIDGSVLLKIPPGVSSGSRLRIRGKGVASKATHSGDATSHESHAKNAGDQIVVLKVTLPKTINPELQSAVRSWQEKYSYNPRAEK